MRDFDLGRRYALVTIPFRPIAHVLDALDHVRVFANARRHLAPNGRLLFDFFHPKLEFLAAPRPERLDFERVEGGLRIRRVSSTVPHRSRQVNEVAFRWEVEGARGRVEARAVSDDVELTDVQGDVTAETVSGDLTLLKVDGRRVEAQTVSGDVRFDGAFRPDGGYSLLTHSGDITLAMPEGAVATIRTAVSNGEVTASFGLPGGWRNRWWRHGW